MNEKICGKCRSWKHDTVEWCCSSKVSEFSMMPVRYGETCNDFESEKVGSDE